jgi:hypothetical protein
VELTAPQEKKLFDNTFAFMNADVQRIISKPDALAKYGKINWVTLNPAIKVVLIDLRYRGDFTTQSREFLQPVVARNDLEGLNRILKNSALWPKVPEDRFKRRAAFLD